MADDAKGDSEGLHPGLVGAALLALAALIFIIQNRLRVPVHFLFISVHAPLWLLLLITSALAIAAAEVGGWSLRRSRRKG
jgi:uncharacterized integral membrane protein